MNISKDRNEIEKLYRAVLTLRTEDECRRFFTDLCTPAELRAMEQRLQVAELLRKGEVYSRIEEITGASSATISRVNRCLQAGEAGYSIALDRWESVSEETGK